MGMISAKEVAALWGVTARTVTSFCKNGKIAGAKKSGRNWLIPVNAKRPVDRRKKAKPEPHEAQGEQTLPLPLPIGVSGFRLASSEYYYVDKTLMIKDFLDARPMVTLFTRPRRFGKTLNMDMLRTFFERTNEDTSVYFKDKKIWSCGKKYRDYQGKYPVVFLSFKDVKRDTWEETGEHIARLVSQEFLRHDILADSNACSEYERAFYRKIVFGEADSTDCVSALAALSEMLHKHYGQPAVIIIDEYDTPIHQGYLKGFYEPAVSFMRNFFSGGFKDNKSLAFGFLTGILRVAKESTFSGLNNIVVSSVLDEKYSGYFGFTKEEVVEMAAYYQASGKLREICDWYDGYRFGNQDIFNPWSVVNYFSSRCVARPYWVSTSNNDIIGEILSHADGGVYNQLGKLLQGESLLTYLDTSVIYPRIKGSPSSVYSFLLVSGYLTTAGESKPFGVGDMGEVALPNKEIRFVYQSEILEALADVIPQASAISVQEAIFAGDSEALKGRIGSLLKASASFYDTAQESFYHGLMLGLLAMTDGRYRQSSNGEAGDGRYDICLTPTQKKLPGIVIELKAEKNCAGSALKKLAEGAVRQIEQKRYDAQLRQAGVEKVYKYGVAFSGKEVEVVMK